MPAQALKKTDIVKENLPFGNLNEFGVGEYGGDVVVIGQGLSQQMGLIVGDNLTLMTLGGGSAFGTLPKRKTYRVGAIFNSGVSEIDASFVFMLWNKRNYFLAGMRLGMLLKLRFPIP